jgi:hypothetical protein
MPSAMKRIPDALERIEHRLNQQINLVDSKTANGESLFTFPEAAKFSHLNLLT